MKKILLCLLILLQYSVICAPQQPITIDHEKEIVFGQSGTFSGHFKIYGDIIRNAITACFEAVNRDGGINGKKLRLVSLDDHGNPEETKQNIDLMRKQGIDMFIGNMGTRSILALLPLIEQKKIALFFPWGGDDQLRNPRLSNIINGLGLLQPQLEALVEYVAQTLKITNVALFHADDDFSSDGTQALAILLKRHNITPVAQEAYNRFTLDIQTPAKKLIVQDPRVVICLATSMPTVKLINHFFRAGHFGTTFLGIDSTFFVPDILQERNIHFHYTSSVPNPATSELKIAQNYRSHIKAISPHENFNVLSFAYYLSAKILIEAMKQSGDDISKEKIIKNIEQMKNYGIQDFEVSFNKNNRHIFGDTTTIIKG